MSKVSVYLDNVFAALPNTPEAHQMRQEICANLEEQYDAAIKQGMNENEALGLVISGFGSVDELKETFGVQEQDVENPLPIQNEEQRAFAMQWVNDYMGFKQTFGRNITIGVCVCILALVASSLLDEFSATSFLSGPVFMLIVAVGAGILIYNGMQHSKYTNMLKMFGIDEEGGWVAPKPQPTETQQKNNRLAKAICSLIGLGAMLAFFVGGFALNLWKYSWIAFPVSGVLCSVVNGALGAPDED